VFVSMVVVGWDEGWRPTIETDAIPNSMGMRKMPGHLPHVSSKRRTVRSGGKRAAAAWATLERELYAELCVASRAAPWNRRVAHLPYPLRKRRRGQGRASARYPRVAYDSGVKNHRKWGPSRGAHASMARKLTPGTLEIRLGRRRCGIVGARAHTGSWGHGVMLYVTPTRYRGSACSGGRVGILTSLSPALLSASLHSSAEVIIETLPSGVSEPSSPAAWHTPLLRRAAAPLASSENVLRCSDRRAAREGLAAAATRPVDARVVCCGRAEQATRVGAWVVSARAIGGLCHCSGTRAAPWGCAGSEYMPYPMRCGYRLPRAHAASLGAALASVACHAAQPAHGRIGCFRPMTRIRLHVPPACVAAAAWAGGGGCGSRGLRCFLRPGSLLHRRSAAPYCSCMRLIYLLLVAPPQHFTLTTRPPGSPRRPPSSLTAGAKGL